MSTLGMMVDGALPLASVMLRGQELCERAREWLSRQPEVRGVHSLVALASGKVAGLVEIKDWNQGFSFLVMVLDLEDPTLSGAPFQSMRRARDFFDARYMPPRVDVVFNPGGES